MVLILQSCALNVIESDWDDLCAGKFLVCFSNSENCYIFFFSHITGQEYPAIVEFAPFQKIAKKRSKKKDAKSGTIEDGEIYVYKSLHFIVSTANSS